MIAPTADLKLLSGRTLSTLSDRFPPAPLLSSSATTTQVFPRRAAEDACATVGAAAAGAPWRLGVGIRAHLSPDPTIQAGRLATDFETPLPSLSASPLGVGMRSHDGDQVSAMMRSALERAVAAAAMMPGEPKLPANYSARKEVLSHRSSPAMSALSTPYASCDNLGALWGAAGEGALSSEVSPRLHPVSAAIAHVPPLQSPSSLAGYSIAPPAAAALPSPAAPASGGGAADGTLLVERPRSAPASAFCAQCTLDGLAVEGCPRRARALLARARRRRHTDGRRRRCPSADHGPTRGERAAAAHRQPQVGVQRRPAPPLLDRVDHRARRAGR